jgi:predicted metal-dependent phosphoesterase TrpH
MPLIDVHVHTTRYSDCSFIEAGHLASAAAARGLDGLILTEHGRVWSRSNLEELNNHREEGVRIFAGQEVTTGRGGLISGDLLILGPPRDFPQGLPPEEIIAMAHQQGGVAVAAHPFRGWLGLGEQLFDLPLDGIEVLSGNAGPEENRRAARAARELGLPALGGSDAHDLDQVGSFATDFEGVVESMEDIVDLIRKGRCRPVCPGR